MKITYAVPVELDSPGGNVQHVLGLCRHASKSGIELKLLCLKGKKEIPKEDFEIVTMNSTDMGALERVYKFSLFALNHIRKGEKPDWVYLRPYPLDYLLFTRHLRKLEIPYAYELNTLWASELISQGKKLKAKIYPWFEEKSIRAAKALFPVTDEIAEHAHNTGGRHIATLVAGNGIVIPEMPVASKQELREKWKLPPDKYLIIMAGFSRPWHGYEKLIHALPLLNKDMHVVLVGSEKDEITTSVISLAQSLGIEKRVHVLPWLNHVDVDELVFCCDLGVSPLALEKKNMKEAQSLKVRHYLAMGIPVLIAGGESQEVLNSGFVLQIPDTAHLNIAEGILKLSKQHVQQESVRDYAKANLSWEAIARKTFEFIKKINHD